MNSRNFFRLSHFLFSFLIFFLAACNQSGQLPLSTSPAPSALVSPSQVKEEPTKPSPQTVESPAATTTFTPTVTQLPSPTALFVTNAYKVLSSYPHDSKAFTEGLYYEDGYLYESTGLYGQSTLRKVELESGNVIQEIHLADDLFGEGLTVVGDKIYQLTWKAKIGFIYDKTSFQKIGEFHYPTEGWGLTFDGNNLIMSDGTSTLHFMSLQDFHEVRTINVRMDGEPVTNLNELEYIQGEIYANIWQTTFIVKIDPQSGQVIDRIDFEGLIPLLGVKQPIDVLNGIAYDTGGDRLFVTGKYWSKIFQVKLLAE